MFLIATVLWRIISAVNNISKELGEAGLNRSIQSTVPLFRLRSLRRLFIDRATVHAAGWGQREFCTLQISTRFSAL